MADAFSMEEDETLKETERFIRTFDKFFDLMNVRSIKECVYKRKPNLRPYRKSTDPRLAVSSNMHTCILIYHNTFLLYSGLKVTFCHTSVNGKRVLMTVLLLIWIKREC